jgi:mannose-6-phosphate isomerase-like protein (cupin superfamily)
MFEYALIEKDCAFGVTQEKAPHKHNCDEFFVFIGTNPQDKTKLGGEVEFWIGEDELTEKITFNTSSIIFVPKNVLHLPVFFKNVKRPFVELVFVPYEGYSLKTTVMYPVRGV